MIDRVRAAFWLRRTVLQWEPVSWPKHSVTYQWEIYNGAVFITRLFDHRQFSAAGSGVLILENLLSGSLRISAPSAFELPFNAENAEIRRGRRENRSI